MNINKWLRQKVRDWLYPPVSIENYKPQPLPPLGDMEHTKRAIRKYLHVYPRGPNDPPGNQWVEQVVDIEERE